jgi:type II secretory pathway pseudopilin PulG
MSFGKSGLSLIEILIAVGVAATLTGIGLAQYAKFNDRQQIKQEVDSFVTHYRLLQKRMQGGDKATCASIANGYYWERVTGGGLSPRLKLSVKCPDLLNLEEMDVYETSNSTIAIGASLMPGHAQARKSAVEFLPLGRGFTDSDNREITFEKGSCEIVVTLSPGGTVVVGSLTGC